VFGGTTVLAGERKCDWKSFRVSGILGW